MSKLPHPTVAPPQRRRWRRSLAVLATILALLSACSAEPPAAPPQQTLVPATAAPGSTAQIPTQEAEITPAPETTAEPLDSTLRLITQTITLAPPQPLTNDQIIDRPLREMRALTDGSRKYRIALWSPGGDWIAATPQDGPGLDAINASSGEVRSLITDTFVLEPVWEDANTLLVQRAAPDGDQLARVMLTEQGSRIEPLVTNAPPIHAVGAGGGIVAFGSNREQLSILNQSAAQHHTFPIAALIAAPAPQPQDDLTIALNPLVQNLESASTVLLRLTGNQAIVTPLSNPGEGLWLPRWALDGSKLALTSIEGRIVSSTADGQERFDLGPGDLPAWSPDGSRLAYAGTSAGLEFLKRDIHLVDWQGQQPRLRLTDANDEQFFTSPSWSPDGSRLAFVEIDDGKIYVGAVPPR